MDQRRNLTRVVAVQTGFNPKSPWSTSPVGDWQYCQFTLEGATTSNRFQAAAQTSAIAEKIRVRLAEPYLLTTHAHGLIEYRCAASIGIIVFNGKNLSQKDVLRRADAAMYQAKSAGRNTVRFYET